MTEINEQIAQLVQHTEDTISYIKRKMRKLRDKGQYDVDEFVMLKHQLAVLEQSWDIINKL